MTAILSRPDFFQIMAFLSEATGHTLAPRRAEIFYHMLCDIEAPALWAAAHEIVSARVYASFPTIGEIRRAAFRFETFAPSAIEAWAHVLLHRYREFDQLVFAATNPILREALTRFGPNNWREFQIAKTLDDERRRFERFYESVAAEARERRLFVSIAFESSALLSGRRGDGHS